MTDIDPEPVKLFQVIREFTVTEIYQAVADDNKSAEDCVYWFNMNSSPVPDTKLISSKQSQEQLTSTQITSEELCLCGHFLTDHQKSGCIWQSCSCLTSVAEVEE
jgi:hypothetical protein